MTALIGDLQGERLAAHIGAHGLTAQQVLDQVDDSFGEPLLVVAAGSVIAGFGNANSDLDIYVVVPDEVASSLPLMSYPEGARIDVVLHGAESLQRRREEVARSAWPPPSIAPGDLVARRKVLDSLSRFGLGLPLAGAEDWETWRQQLDGDLTEWLQGWYAVDAVRKRVASHALAAAKPMVAAVRAGEALIAALERHCVTSGERYFKWKWLGEKLHRLGDQEGLVAFELAACPPMTASQVPSYLQRVGEFLDHYLAEVDTTSWRAHVRPAIGTSLHPFGESLLMSRWGMRAVSLPVGSMVGVGDCWDYRLDEPWHSDIASVFAADMAWLGLRSLS